MDQLDLAILFWFYKEPEICENRLKLLKKYNSRLKIFGLYGGDQKEAGLFKNTLSKYFDDLYISPYVLKAYKWYYGDLMLLDWYKNRGKLLKWDSIIEIQWDTLVFTSLERYFGSIKKNEIFLSGLRVLTKDIENRWWWTRTTSPQRKTYLKFIQTIKKCYGYNEEIFCWLAIIAIFPRIFFKKYLMIKNKKVGFLEYKIPSLCHILDIPFYIKDLGVLWDPINKSKNNPLNALPEEIKEEYIKTELNRDNGWRIFHPYFKVWNEFTA